MTSLKRQGPSWHAWLLVLVVVFGNRAHCTVVPGPAPDGSTTGNTFVQDLSMPGVKPTQHDEYICTAKRVDSREAFIVQYEAHSANNKAHHILLFGCSDVDPKNIKKGHWGCGEGNICQSMKIMFAWAKNAPPTKLPPDVGFRIGGDSGVNYLVLEIHYAHPLNESDSSGILLHTTYEPQNYIAGIFLLLAQDSKIPPRQPAVHTDINCLYKSRIPIHPFAYRVHAHSLGVVISGYTYNTKQREWTLLGKGNPQWPQAFYPMDKVHKVDNTDILVARCTFNSSARDRWTYIGSTAADEMCNFYIMYYTDSQRGTPFGECVDSEYPSLVDLMPLDSDVPLPRNPLLEEHAHGSNPMQHSKVTKRPLNIPQDSSLESSSNSGREHEISNGGQSTVGDSDEVNGPVPYRGKVHHGNYNQGVEGNSATTGSGVPEGKSLPASPLPNLYKDKPSWPNTQKKLGQVTAVSLDSSGNVWIFHRGDRVWDARTFDVRNRYKQMALGPIQENTLIKFDQEKGTVLYEWGSNLFYMPHGLTIDKDGNIWVTDVALHQVMKFAPGGSSEKPLLALGTPLEPGSDNSHFCKPASVAVAKNGEFFVADGYCNSRILKYSPTGTLQLQWGKSTTSILGFKVGAPPPYAFDIPHKVALAEDKGLVCVADRENGRIQCFSMNNGSFHCQINPPEFGTRLFAVAYSPAQGGLLYAVNGPTVYGNSNNVQGFVVNFTSQSVIGSIRPQLQNLQFPHDVAVALDGSAVYITEIGPNRLWKFVSSTDNANSASPKQLNQHAANKAAVQQPSSTLSPSSTEASSSLPLRNSQADSKEVFMSPLSSDSSSFALSMIIIAVLSIPILLMIIITVVIRLRKQGKFHTMNLGHVKGWMTGYKQPNNDRFNLGNFLHPHKGFDRVNLEESDAELDNSDSDVEEYSASVQKA